MAYEFENESGEVGTYYSPEELETQKAEAVATAKAEADAKLAEAEAHYKTKINEFAQAKKGVDEKEATVDTAIAEERAKREELEAKLNTVVAEKENSTKMFLMQQVVGTDAESIKKLEEAYNMLDSKLDMQDRIKAASRLAGFGEVQPTPTLGSFSGGYAPTFTNETKAKDDLQEFQQAFGFDKYLNK